MVGDDLKAQKRRDPYKHKHSGENRFIKHRKEMNMETQEMNKRFAMPYRLQFFAEGGEPDGEGGNPDPEKDGEPTIEELKAELEISRNAAENEKKAREKDKAALDKALKEVARLTKEARANKTEAEIEAENKRVEAEKMQEELTELRSYRQLNEAKERYLMQGMDAETAQKAAEAEVKHDMDALMEIQKAHTDSLIKAKEAEWKKSRPDANVGGGSFLTKTKEEILAIEDETERQRAIAENISLFG